MDSGCLNKKKSVQYLSWWIPNPIPTHKFQILHRERTETRRNPTHNSRFYTMSPCGGYFGQNSVVSESSEDFRCYLLGISSRKASHFTHTTSSRLPALITPNQHCNLSSQARAQSSLCCFPPSFHPYNILLCPHSHFSGWRKYCGKFAVKIKRFVNTER